MSYAARESTVFFFVLLAISLLSFWVGITRTVYGFQSRDWPHVQGMILTSTVTRRPTGVTGADVYAPVVTYTYEVSGRRFEGSKIAFYIGGGGLRWANEISDRYPKGSTVKVFYDPRDPSRAVLQPGHETTAGTLIPFAFSLGIAGFAFFKIFPKMRESVNKRKN